MARYLDPKADLTFKRVFGEHLDLVKSLLNALLPFEKPEEEIQDLEYLSPEMMPDTPFNKFSIVDVRCRDKQGRQFIVEMQMVWSPMFMKRVMFNSAKAYVGQLDRSQNYHLLEPVYSLNLVNQVFLPDIPEYYHYYRMVHDKYSGEVIDGLHLVFVELPKFKAETMTEKKMHVLWLRFLTEVEERLQEIPQEMLESPEISKAVDVVKESAYSKEEMMGYDKFWDIIRTESSFYGDAHNLGMAKGMAQGMAKGMAKGIARGMEMGVEKGRAEGRVEGRAEGLAEGITQGIHQTAKRLKDAGVLYEVISSATGLPIEEIEQL